MASHRVLRSVLLSASVLVVDACASQPASTTGSLDDKYFQREVSNYMKFEFEGQTVYCQNEPAVASLIPHKWCITESALRQRVENARRDRNPVAQTRIPPG